MKTLATAVILILMAPFQAKADDIYIKTKNPAEKSKALFNATDALDLKAIEYLLSWQTPLETVNARGETAFGTLYRHYDSEHLISAIKLFQRYKANINAEDSNGETLLAMLLGTYPQDVF